MPKQIGRVYILSTVIYFVVYAMETLNALFKLHVSVVFAFFGIVFSTQKMYMVSQFIYQMLLTFNPFSIQFLVQPKPRKFNHSYILSRICVIWYSIYSLYGFVNLFAMLAFPCAHLHESYKFHPDWHVLISLVGHKTFFHMN